MNPEKHGMQKQEARRKESIAGPVRPIARTGRERLASRIHLLNQRLRDKHAPFRVRSY
jgi:hypothetical protein